MLFIKLARRLHGSSTPVKKVQFYWPGINEGVT